MTTETKEADVKSRLVALNIGITNLHDEIARMHILKRRLDNQIIAVEEASTRLGKLQAELEEASDAS